MVEENSKKLNLSYDKSIEILRGCLVEEFEEYYLRVFDIRVGEKVYENVCNICLKCSKVCLNLPTKHPQNTKRKNIFVGF